MPANLIDHLLIILIAVLYPVYTTIIWVPIALHETIDVTSLLSSSIALTTEESVEQLSKD